MNGLIGRKLGMAQIFDDAGLSIQVTLIEAGPCYVTQLKSPDKDGYQAVQLGFGEVKTKRLTSGQRGHLKANELPNLSVLRELRFKGDVNYAAGDKVTVAQAFKHGDLVDVVGVSKGRGFQGAIKRHGFHGGPVSHGQSDRRRAPGSIGAGTTPGRVPKGTRMAGRMGNQRVTAQHLVVALVDDARNLLAIRGAVPGPTGAVVFVRVARKQKNPVAGKE
ncbi:50S ribosomal protein L3 [Anaerolineae bacterium]|nr:50S ribosomal protein L3 [Anaerolineaceae bacterium]GDX67835.1 50S ribosomal protein L3 [Anaerolineae bacterium]